MLKVPKIELSFRVIRPYDYVPIILKSSSESASVLRCLFEQGTFDFNEEMVMLCLNRRNEILHYCNISKGGVNGTVCDPKVILMIALQSGAVGIIVSHNHPSGNSVPSQSDLLITKKLKAACEVVDIKLIDHIIITYDAFYSMADEGNL